jgi:hypothetical protein
MFKKKTQKLMYRWNVPQNNKVHANSQPTLHQMKTKLKSFPKDQEQDKDVCFHHSSSI